MLFRPPSRQTNFSIRRKVFAADYTHFYLDTGYANAPVTLSLASTQDDDRPPTHSAATDVFTKIPAATNRLRRRDFDCPNKFRCQKKPAATALFFIQRGHIRQLVFGPQPTLFFNAGLTARPPRKPKKWFLNLSEGGSNQAIVTQRRIAESASKSQFGGISGKRPKAKDSFAPKAETVENQGFSGNPSTVAEVPHFIHVTKTKAPRREPWPF